MARTGASYQYQGTQHAIQPVHESIRENLGQKRYLCSPHVEKTRLSGLGVLVRVDFAGHALTFRAELCG